MRGVMPGQAPMMMHGQPPNQQPHPYPPMIQPGKAAPPSAAHHQPMYHPSAAAREAFPQAAQPERTLNPTELATADPEAQKQMIGEKIFPLIQPIEPRLAG